MEYLNMWKPELTWEISRDAIVDKQVRNVVDDAHNAALKAEHTNAEAWRLTCNGKEKAYVKMEQQLIQAQAAIAEHNKGPHPCRGITIELSALEQHDEQVRKPLLEALERLINAWSDARDHNACQFAKDVVAKVKTKRSPLK